MNTAIQKSNLLEKVSSAEGLKGLDSTTANKLWEKLRNEFPTFGITVPMGVLQFAIENINNLDAAVEGHYEYDSVKKGVKYILLQPAPMVVVPVEPQVRSTFDFMAKNKEYFEKFKKDFEEKRDTIESTALMTVSKAEQILQALLKLYGLETFLTSLYSHIVNGLIKGKLAISSTGDPETKKTPQDTKKKEKKKEKEATDDGAKEEIASEKDIYIKTPQHASIRIDEASDTLTYGEHDPLGQYTKPIKLPLNETIEEIFGYKGGWQEYKRINYYDLTKKTIVRRADGTRVVADKPQNLERKKGDTLIQSATLWPFHVYFAYRELAEAQTEKEELYKNIFVQIRKENIKALKALPKKIYDAYVSKYPNQDPQDVRDQMLARFLEWPNFLKNQHLFDKDSKYYDLFSKRLGILGLVDLSGRIWGGARAGSHLQQAIHYPPEGLANRDIINLVKSRRKENKEIFNVKQKTVFTPEGLQLFDDVRGKGFPYAPSLGDPEFPGSKKALTPALVPALAGHLNLGRGISSAFVRAAEELGAIAKNSLWLGIVIKMPVNEEPFTEAEKIFLKRMGVNPDSKIKFDPFAGEFNTKTGALVVPSRGNTEASFGDTSDVEDDGAGDVENKTSKPSMKDLPEDIKDAMKDPNMQAEDLIKRRLDFCKKLPPEKRSGVWICALDEEGKKIWRDVAFLTKDAQKKPTKEKVKAIEKKQKELLNKASQPPTEKPKDKKRSVDTEENKIWWGELKKFKSTGNISVKWSAKAYAHENTIKYLESLSKFRKGNLENAKWFVEDISKKEHGTQYRNMGNHKSHSVGLDVDISIPLTKGEKTSIKRNKPGSKWWRFKSYKRGGSVTDYDIPAIIDFARHAYRAGVHRIFWDRKGKKLMMQVLNNWYNKVESAQRTKSIRAFGVIGKDEYDWIRKNVKHEDGHSGHFHVRIAQDTQRKRIVQKFKFRKKNRKTGELEDREVKNSSRAYWNPRAVKRARKFLSTLQEGADVGDLANFINESLNKLVQEIKEGKVHELENKTL